MCGNCNNANCLGCNNNCNGLNPCTTSETNTAECESLSSQINNFTTQFFGTVVKTEVDGKVVWSLPCNLDVGLPNNPRGVDEGLACYTLRLFNEGIIGLTGPQGAAGADGEAGRNAFTVTLASFTQPTLGSPNIQITTLFNPAILVGMYIFIEDSGWYLITAKDDSGALWLTFVKSVSSPPGTIPVGNLVVPSGFPGVSVTGPQGPQGATGPQGTPGASFTATNGMYYDGIGGTNYNLGVTYAAVDFSNSSARVVLPTVGTYLITVSVDIIGLAGVATTDEVFFTLRNNTTLADLNGAEHATSRIFQDQLRSVSFTVTHTISGANEQITLRGKCTTVDKVAVVWDRTTITYVKLS